MADDKNETATTADQISLPLSDKEELAVIVQRLKKHGAKQGLNQQAGVRLDLAQDLISSALIYM